MKLNKNNVIAYHTALEFYGLGHSAFYTNFIMNKMDIADIENLEGKTIKYVMPTINSYNEINRNNNIYHVTSLEATFLDCLLNLKYCGGFEEFFRCIRGIDSITDKKTRLDAIPNYEKNIELNLNLLFDLLKKYKTKKLYNLTGFVLEALKIHWNLDIPETFFDKIKKHIRKTTVTIEESTNNIYTINKTWNIRYPKELTSAITGDY